MFWFWRAELKSGNFTHKNMLIDMSFCVSYIRKKDKELFLVLFQICSLQFTLQGIGHNFDSLMLQNDIIWISEMAL